MQETGQSNFRVKVIVGVGLFALLSIGLIIYFSFLRVQDGEYEAASKQIDIMTAKAAAFETAGSALFPQTVTETQAKEAKRIADEYKAARAALEKSRAVTNDGEVAKAYTNIKSAVAQYGDSSADMVTTVVAMANIKQQCSSLLDQVYSITTQVAFAKASATCKAMLEKYPSVPLATFNSSYFLPYRQDVKDVMAALDAYYATGQNGDTAKQQKAQVSLTAAMKEITSLNENNAVLISNTANPTDSLQKLKTTIDKRRTVFLR